MSKRDDIIVSADWLQARLGQPGLSIVDGSWYLPTQNRDAFGEYEVGLRGTRFGDLNTNLPRLGELVIFERALAQAVGHGRILEIIRR